MTDLNTEALLKEVEQYRKERDQIRKIIGGIGGARSAQVNKIANICFIVAIVILFGTDILRHVTPIPIPMPEAFSTQLGILLVSLKIVWMIHLQTKVEHFQFWMLNTIEFRINDISKQLRTIEKEMKGSTPANPEN